MRAAVFVSLAFAAICLTVAAIDLLTPRNHTFCAGPQCKSWSCGSPAFPKSLIDFENKEHAANCAGGTAASVAPVAIGLAGVALVVATAATARRPKPPSVGSAPPAAGHDDP